MIDGWFGVLAISFVPSVGGLIRTRDETKR
jgi:hypothetical protein